MGTGKCKNDQLDILGCQPSLFKLFTQISLIYANVQTSGTQDRIANALRAGLDTLSAQLPWLCGTVVNENSGPKSTGTFRIVASKQIPLVIKDLRPISNAPTLDKLRNAQYPFSMLDEQLITPCMTLNLPGQAVGLVAETGPVLAVQANFILGGLILTVVAQHNVMDMVGLATVMNWLSKACAGTQLSQEELAIGKIDKGRVINLHDVSWHPDKDWLRRLQVQALPNAQEPPSPSIATSKPRWAYVMFSIDSTRALKKLATETKDPACNYISSDDAICAFIWQRLSGARAARIDAKSKTVFARAVDLRGRMAVPSTYAGTLTNMTYNESSLEDVSREPLGAIASKMRQELNSPNLARDTRALATVINRLQNKGRISITAPVDPSTGIMLSSWASVKLHELDFNLGLGKPLAVRRPAFVPVESLMYIMPKNASDETVVGMCLRDEDWTMLKQDKGWTRFAMYVG